MLLKKEIGEYDESPHFKPILPHRGLSIVKYNQHPHPWGGGLQLISLGENMKRVKGGKCKEKGRKGKEKREKMASKRVK